MERDSKRKAPATPGVDGDARAAKRQRVPTGVDFGDETPASTTEVGLKFIESLKNAKDKTGRPIATEFLSLPDPKLYPAYYEEILLPIAVDTIEEKLARQAYSTITTLESDVKRMVANAKLYNDKRSAIYEDAERVRKTASNFFTKYNPAYRDPTYVAVATPIPDESPHSAKAPPSKTLNTNVSSPIKPSDSVRPGRTVSEESRQNSDSTDFKGKSFQQAQEQIMEELIHYVDEESGLEIFSPFNNLPPRNLADYYQLIKNPQSLKGVQKRVRGIHGRNPPTGLTDFHSWDSFEQEVSLIWRNAREYNEDGSEIFELSAELEDYFQQRLAIARTQVEQPAQPKLKINMSTAPKQSIKLKFGAAKDSPSTSSRPSTPAAERGTPGVIVHNEALQRQQDTVSAGMNGGKSSSTAPPPARNPFQKSAPAFTPIIPILNSRPPSRSNQSPPVHVNGVKSEAEPSPALAAARPNGHPPQLASSAMPPPLSLTMRPASGSPAPSHPFSHHTQAYSGPLKELVTNRFRPAGETAADSILPLLQISSHPSLGLPKPFSLRIPASSRHTQQSLTITAPASHTHLLITPHVPVALTSRPYRLFVKVNDNRVSEVVKPGMERDKSKPQFEARLTRGEVTRIEVEVLAGSAEKKGGREVVELERVTVFVHVLKGH